MDTLRESVGSEIRQRTEERLRSRLDWGRGGGTNWWRSEGHSRIAAISSRLLGWFQRKREPRNYGHRIFLSPENTTRGEFRVACVCGAHAQNVGVCALVCVMRLWFYTSKI